MKKRRKKEVIKELEKIAVFVYGFDSVKEMFIAKKLASERIWGYQYRGNGYGFWTLKEAVKRMPDKKLAWLYCRLDNGRLIPVGNETTELVWERILVGINLQPQWLKENLN